MRVPLDGSMAALGVGNMFREEEPTRERDYPFVAPNRKP